MRNEFLVGEVVAVYVEEACLTDGKRGDVGKVDRYCMRVGFLRTIGSWVDRWLEHLKLEKTTNQNRTDKQIKTGPLYFDS